MSALLILMPEHQLLKPEDQLLMFALLILMPEHQLLKPEDQLLMSALQLLMRAVHRPGGVRQASQGPRLARNLADSGTTAVKSPPELDDP